MNDRSEVDAKVTQPTAWRDDVLMKGLVLYDCKGYIKIEESVIGIDFDGNVAGRYSIIQVGFSASFLFFWDIVHPPIHFYILYFFLFCAKKIVYFIFNNKERTQGKEEG